MNLRIILFVTAVLISFHEHLFAQDLSDIIDPNGANPSLLWNSKRNTVKGSPYLFDSWQTAEIVMNKRHFVCEEFNIDLINQVPVINKGEQAVALKALLIDTILIRAKGNDLVFIKAIKPVEMTVFFPEVIAQGKTYWLLKEHEKEIKEAVTKTGYESTKSNNDVPYIISKTNYYFRHGHELIQISKRNLRQNFKSLYAQVKEAKLNIRLEEDLIELTNLLN